MLISIMKPDFEFTDERGSLIQLVREGFKQINVIKSTADSFRGGHYHQNNAEAFYVISGEMKLVVFKEENADKESYTFKAEDMFLIPSGIIHSFYFIKETILVSMYSNGVELPGGEKDIIAVG